MHTHIYNDVIYNYVMYCVQFGHWVSLNYFWPVVKLPMQKSPNSYCLYALLSSLDLRYQITKVRGMHASSRIREKDVQISGFGKHCYLRADWYPDHRYRKEWDWQHKHTALLKMHLMHFQQGSMSAICDRLTTVLIHWLRKCLLGLKLHGTRRWPSSVQCWHLISLGIKESTVRYHTIYDFMVARTLEVT